MPPALHRPVITMAAILLHQAPRITRPIITMEDTREVLRTPVGEEMMEAEVAHAGEVVIREEAAEVGTLEVEETLAGKQGGLHDEFAC